GARGGGPLLYVGCHVLDQVLWVARQRVRRVFAQIERNDEGGVEASAAITIHFDGGAAAQVLTSQKLGGRYGWLDVMGSDGRLRTEWESNVVYVESRKVEAYRHPTEIEVPADAYLPQVSAEPMVSVAGIKYIRTWAAEMAEFIAAIVEDREPAVTGEDAVRVLEVTDAAFESGRSGGPVEL
ncbi:MAG: Gfo/Idh/MocA family oxidoreductase, partial [Armatimonadota bacterium]